MSRWHQKADALYTAWVQTIHSPPSSEALRLALAVAQHETRCGDAWPGEHNWGAVQKRGLSSVELELLGREGIVVDAKGSRAAANSVCKAAAERLQKASDDGEIWEIHEEALHVDSSPIWGLYLTWFWAFDNDLDGAKQFLRVLILKMPKVKTVMAGSKPTAEALATAMYEHVYYEGFHDPRVEGGKQANIDAYAKEVRYHEAIIATALQDWQPPTVPEPSELERSITTVRGQRKALNYLGYGRPLLSEDTDAVDRKFTAVVGFFQGANDDISDRPLQVDGEAGPKTQLALLRAIATFDAMRKT